MESENQDKASAEVKIETSKEKLDSTLKSRITNFFLDRFNLDDDCAQQSEVIDNIRRGVVFKGTNMWVLIFATYIASLGLNVNSAAVIIGAMLISPLMGPIMGIGLSVGINDFELMKNSLRNFGFMVAVSIITSTIYFTISPLTNAQSEMLARTMPTTYDVLIAFFGGLAGAIAQTRKDRTLTVIPGVAIATALMPPLCTAGFGLATGQFRYFLGAAYLFFINTVFIAIATYAIVRFLKYEKKHFLDKNREKKVKRYLTLIVILTLVPSVFISYRLVQTSIFTTNADKFVAEVFNFENTMVADYSKKYNAGREHSHIDIMLVGDPLSVDAIAVVKSQLKTYSLNDVDLNIRQATANDAPNFDDIQKSYMDILDEKNKQIKSLKSQISSNVNVVGDTLPYSSLSKEASVVEANISKISFSKQVWYNEHGVALDTTLICMVKQNNVEQPIDSVRLSKWIKVRTGFEEVKIYNEK